MLDFSEEIEEENVLLDRIRSFWTNIKYGVKNFWRYRKVIWNDRDWDYAFLLYLVEFKTKAMSDTIRKYGMSVSSEEIADELAEVSQLLGRLANDDFEKHIDEHYKKWDKDKDFCFDDIYTTKEKGKEYIESLKLAWKNDAQDRKLAEKRLFKLLTRYRNWWD
jgi:hypothetical protein